MLPSIIRDKTRLRHAHPWTVLALSLALYHTFEAKSSRYAVFSAVSFLSLNKMLCLFTTRLGDCFQTQFGFGDHDPRQTCPIGVNSTRLGLILQPDRVVTQNEQPEPELDLPTPTTRYFLLLFSLLNK